MRPVLLLAAIIVAASISEASAGPCRCRKDRDSAGRICGERSAEARPEGLAPSCGTSAPPTPQSAGGEVDNPCNERRSGVR